MSDPLGLAPFYWGYVATFEPEIGDFQSVLVVEGNIHNVDNPEEPVLGYFDASGVVQK